MISWDCDLRVLRIYKDGRLVASIERSQWIHLVADLVTGLRWPP